MIRGIGGQPYIDLDSHIDVVGFQQLHYKICRGIVNTSVRKQGNMSEPGRLNVDLYTVKPLWLALREYRALPMDHEIRTIGREIGEMSNRDSFAEYLKLALGAYDPYEMIFLKDIDGSWETRFDEKQYKPEIANFPELRTWMENLVTTGVFTHLGRILIFRAEHDVQMMYHQDFCPPDEYDYFDHRHEFIHIRPNLDKPFNIYDPETRQAVPVTSHSCFFNDQDFHSGGRVSKQTYSVRIDGVFTDEFRQQIGIGHLAYY
jgi:hypothetical protein